MLSLLLFAAGLVLLIKGADVLVDGASSMARRLRVSDLVIGLTVVAFGTSMPELFVNIVASIKGNSAIAIGNILGSNIANILLILGISAVIFPLNVGRGTVWKEIPLSLMAAALLGILANDELLDGGLFSALTRIDGLVFLSFFIVFLFYSFSIARRVDGLDGHIPSKQYGLRKSILLIMTSLIALSLGAKWIVEGAVRIAAALGISQSTIGLTIVAVGTSLPELATSAMAASKRKPEIAVGNVVGSNIFNIFFILGISSVMRPIEVVPKNNIDISVVVLASLLLFVTMFTGRKKVLDRWEGIVFLLLYVAYIVYLIMFP